MKSRIVLPAMLIAAGIAAAGGFALADQNSTNDAIADLAKANVTMLQAVTTAEQQVGGKATRAELESERGAVVFNVEVASGQKVFDVKVDATDGKVLASKEDKGDRSDREHDDD